MIESLQAETANWKSLSRRKEKELGQMTKLSKKTIGELKAKLDEALNGEQTKESQEQSKY